MTPLILTYSGRHVNPLDLRPTDIHLEDIAHALACCNRFAGHCRRPISVAQHSVYVARLCGDQILPVQRQALLHDASEAYLGDITKWLKNSPEFAGYRVAENRVQSQIYGQFNCELIDDRSMQEADKLMLRFEGQQAFGVRTWKKWTSQLPNYPLVTQEEITRIGPWKPWSWQSAKESFLVHARSLGLQ
jgi:hypothetical protein